MSVASPVIRYFLKRSILRCIQGYDVSRKDRQMAHLELIDNDLFSRKEKIAYSEGQVAYVLKKPQIEENWCPIKELGKLLRAIGYQPSWDGGQWVKWQLIIPDESESFKVEDVEFYLHRSPVNVNQSYVQVTQGETSISSKALLAYWNNKEELIKRGLAVLRAAQNRAANEKKIKEIIANPKYQLIKTARKSVTYQNTRIEVNPYESNWCIVNGIVLDTGWRSRGKKAIQAAQYVLDHISEEVEILLRLEGF